MVTWSGLGFLVVFAALGFLLLTEYIVELIFNDQQYFQQHGWCRMLGLWIAAVVVWLLGSYLNKKSSEKLVDEESGTETQAKPNHSLFFIPMIYWGPILFVLGIAFYFFK